ncbi:hypothetical protein [Nocardioides sp. GY 10127]|uniref:hypothetical protein n=1 Tax=Nocardioides sp. GY 10127 TaxID=2569762 RepID=UPI0014583CFA|nr:hypothetical protein [Nocardioides sp. GY 10127]
MSSLPKAVEMAGAFALAVSRSGEAMFIGESNKRLGYAPVHEAAASGTAYGVVPVDSVAALDLDTPELRTWAAPVQAYLQSQGCRTVLCNSGRPGHQHLWVLMPPGWSYEYLKARLETAGMTPPRWDVVRGGMTRPPYAPHRLGGRSEIVDLDPAAALRWFREQRPGRIPDKVEQMLWWLDPQHVVSKRGVIDRGRTVYKAAVVLVNHRCTFEDFTGLLAAKETAVTSKFHELPPARRADYADEVWRRATAFVRENPPSAVSRPRVHALRAQMGLHAWNARTGASDRAVYAALLGIADEASSLLVDASLRRLSDAAGVSPGTVSQSLLRLGDLALIRRLADRRTEAGASFSYELLQPREAKSLPVTHTLPLLRGPKAMCAEESKILEDIFSNGSGLGLSCRETWEAAAEYPATAKAICQMRCTPVAHATVLKHLRTLRDSGLVEKRGHTWTRVNPTLEQMDRLSRLLGVKNKAARRRDRHTRERTDFRQRFNRP